MQIKWLFYILYFCTWKSLNKVGFQRWTLRAVVRLYDLHTKCARIYSIVGRGAKPKRKWETQSGSERFKAVRPSTMKKSLHICDIYANGLRSWTYEFYGVICSVGILHRCISYRLQPSQSRKLMSNWNLNTKNLAWRTCCEKGHWKTCEWMSFVFAARIQRYHISSERNLAK